MRSVASPAATAGTESPALAGIFGVLAPHLTELDQFLHGQLAEFEPEIRAMAGDCIDTAGRRIRPALVFLSGWRGAGEVAPELVRAAAVVELIHLATLVHHDIMDDADGGRDRRKGSRENGPTPAILLGDALFAHGLHLATHFPTAEICAAITESTRRVCAGEIVQTPGRRSIDVTRANYQRVVELKTAELFRVSCFLGARLAGAEAGYVEATSHFGRHLGSAYQIHDDLAEVLGSGASSGKTLGTDTANRRLTLPLLVLLERLPAADAEVLRAEIEGARPPQPALRLRQIREHEHAIFPAIADAVQTELTAATAALREYPAHPPTPLLLGLCDVLQSQVAGLRPATAV